eukprot:jgi/Ulvmu1/3880/UM018_0101.1
MISARVTFTSKPVRATPVPRRRNVAAFADPAESAKDAADQVKEAASDAAEAVEQAIKDAAGDVREAVPEDAPKGFDKVLARKTANKERDEEGDLKHGQDSGTGSGWPLNQ